MAAELLHFDYQHKGDKALELESRRRLHLDTNLVRNMITDV